ncbi:MAG TPA: protein kinase [Kofleriaceae bacterium]|nr:protein kinase [Kofleriaceae bacterium]
MGPTPEQRGIVRLGRYTLLRPLGAGGMAELFLARADGIEGFMKLCAVKRILPHKAKNERFVRMFLNEARLVAGLDHPNICHVHDIGREGGEYYFAMEYVHGQDLARIMHTAPHRVIRLENALHIALGVCAGLHHAHEARDESGKMLDIVHRDVSPSNVLISYQGSVKLVDFGVAKAASVISETREGVVKGKYGYMSPEQCLGETLDRRSDVFSVGILLWEMTVGRRLYKSNGDLATLQRVVYVDAPRPTRFIPEYPPVLERIVMKALSRDRQARYQSAQELQLDLESFARDQRLSVSSVVMASEMSQLFRERVDAWKLAQQAGRSLADHLAEVSTEEPIDNSEPDDLDGVINDLDAGVVGDELQPPNATSADRPGAIARQTQVSQPMPVVRSSAMVTPVPRQVSVADVQPRRSRAPLLLALLLLAGGGAAAWIVYGPGSHNDIVPASAASDGSSDGSNEVTMQVVADGSTAVQVVSAEPTVGDANTAHTTQQAESVDAAVANVGSKKKKTGGHATKHGGKTQTSHHATAESSDEEDDEDDDETTEVVTPPSPRPPPPKDEPKAGSAAKPAGPAPGTMDAAGVRAAVHARLGEVTACTARARMDDSDLKGRIVLRIDVDGTGRVTKVTASSRDGGTPALESCIVKAVSGWSFPAPVGGVRAAFSYPFGF